MAAKLPVLTTGDNINWSVTLYKDKQTFTIPGTATVKARIISADHQTAYTDAITQTEIPAADWANSLVAVLMTDVVTSAITHRGRAVLEVEVDDNGKSTWFGDIQIKTGTI